jgi:hypothetical protein
VKVGWGIIGFLIALFVTTVGDLVSEELRSSLDRMPYAVLRLAIRRLPAELRQNVGDEWLAELHHILHHTKGLPLTRLISAIPYTLGLLRTARRIGRELRAVRTGRTISQKSTSSLFSLRKIALAGGMTVSFATVIVGITAPEAIVGGAITTGGLNTFIEQTPPDSGVSSLPTFRDPSAFTGEGPRIQRGRVEVVCRFYVPNGPPSTQPGWWYLVASSPWNRQYYTVANSYLNGDPPEGPYRTSVDSRVPVC